MKEFPSHRSDEIDRESIRTNLDQYSQIDHDEDARKFIEYMDAIQDTREAIEGNDPDKYLAIENVRISTEKIAENIVKKINKQGLDRQGYSECKNDKSDKKIYAAIRGFLKPEINTNPSTNICGDCCDFVQKRITIPTGHHLEQSMEVKKILAKRSFLKGIREVVRLQEQLQCEIPSLVAMTPSRKDGKLYLGKMTTEANKESTVILKDVCFTGASEESGAIN